jgi:hypothetical protein
MASNDNGKHKLEEEVKSSMVRKRLQLSDDAGVMMTHLTQRRRRSPQRNHR